MEVHHQPRDTYEDDLVVLAEVIERIITIIGQVKNKAYILLSNSGVSRSHSDI